LNNSLGAVLFVGILVMGLAAGWVGGNMNIVGSKAPAAAQTTSVSLPLQTATGKVVYLDLIADWGAPGYDAFIVPSYVNGTSPQLATNSTTSGPNNNVTVPFGVPVTFIITNLDTAVLENYTGPASIDFTIYSNTEDGQVAYHYSRGSTISELPAGHTFSVPSLNIDVPIPPDTVVSFTYTFTAPGIYEFKCMTPCGPGMYIPGYMIGYLIVA
jgi:hypothetical protein